MNRLIHNYIFLICLFTYNLVIMDNNKNKREWTIGPWLIIGTVVFILFLLVFGAMKVSQSGDTQIKSSALSDTLIIGNDSLRTDILRMNYGFYVAVNEINVNYFTFNYPYFEHTIAYKCFNSRLKGIWMHLIYKCYSEEGIIIHKYDMGNEIGADDGESEILKFSMNMEELYKYRGIVTIIPYIEINRKEFPLPSVRVKFGGMGYYPKILKDNKKREE